MSRGWTFDPSLPTIGRDEILRSATAALRGGTGILLRGAAGVGKSRVMRDLRDRLEPLHPLHLIGNESSASIPLGLFMSVVPQGASPGESLVTIAARVRRSILRRRTDLLLVDDAAWVDAASAGLIFELVRSGVPLIASARTGELLHDAFSALVRHDFAAEFPVHPLTEGDTYDLVRGQFRGYVDVGVCHAVHSRSLGNPLLVREVIRHAFVTGCIKGTAEGWILSKPIPAVGGLDDIIGRHIDTLTPDVRRVVELVALAEPLSRSHLSATVSEDARAAAEAAELVVCEGPDGDQTVRTSHPLFRDAAIVKMPASRRRALLTELIRVWETLSPQESADPRGEAQVGIWRFRRGDVLPPDVLLTLAETVHTSDPHLCELLVNAVSQEGNDVTTLTRLASLLAHQHRVEQSLSILAEIERRPLSQETRLPIILTRAFLLAIAANRPEDALVLIEQAMAEFGPLPPVVAQHALALLLSARVTDAIAEALATFRDRGLPPHIRVHAGLTLRCAYTSTGDARAFADVGAQMKPLLALSTQELPEGSQSFDLSEMMFLVVAENVPSARQCGWLGYRQALEAGNDAVRAQFAQMLGWANCLYGDITGGRELLREAMSATGIYARSTQPLVIARFAHALALVGRTGEAHRVLGTLERIDTTPLQQPTIHAARLATLLREGQRDRAIEFGYRAAKEARAFDPLLAGQLLYQLVRVGEKRAARHLLVLLRKPSNAAQHSKAEHAQAVLADDSRGIERAAQSLADCGLRLYAFEAYAQAASHYRRDGHRKDTARVLLRSGELRSQAPGLTSIILDNVSRTSEMTTRERQVAQLAAEGRADREIAALTGISVRTVSTHLSRVYAKAGIGGRAELATVLGPIPNQ